MQKWRAWHQWWKSRERDFLQRMARRALASAVYRWRLGASTSRSRRQGAVHLLGSLLLRKCLLALADNAYTAAVLRKVLESYRRRTLRDGLEAWGSVSVSQDIQNNTDVAEISAHCATTRRQRRHPGKPRKVHCRCVYAVSRGQRCTCAPRSHLLRRVEELHRLVAKGLDTREGGHRLLSHVVQRSTAPCRVETGRSSGQTLSPPHVSDGRRKPSCGDLQQGSTNARVRLVGGGPGCGPSLKRRGSDKLPRTGTSKPASPSGIGDADSYRASSAAAFSRGSVAQHALLVEGQIDALTGAGISPVVAGGSRCV